MRIRVASTLPARLRGLLGRSEYDGLLLLVPCNDIHTVGMRRCIDVAFVAHDGTVLESHRDVAPRRRLRNRNAAATVERFSCGERWYEPGERIQHDMIGPIEKEATR